MKSRFSGRKVDAKAFLIEAMRGERNFTDCDMSSCDLAAYPAKVDRFNQLMIDRCVPAFDPCYQEIVSGNWLDLDTQSLDALMERNLPRFRSERLYFTQANMSGLCAICMWLPMADLRYTYLDSAELTESFLVRAMFDDAEGPSAQFENADMRGTSICGARFLRANFAGGQFQGSKMVQSNFVNSNFQEANLDGIELENTDLSGCDLSGASLIGVRGLGSANWQGARFKHTRIKKEDVSLIRKKRDLDNLDMSTPEQRALRKGK